MAIGFKKSLFGFNREDVFNYIENTHKAFKDKEDTLNKKIDELSSDLKLSKQQEEKLLAEKQELDLKLNEFNRKYEEIERLSENIGKLYLVAQTNARAIINNSDENAKVAIEEVNKNLFSIDEAHKSLQELRQRITKTSDDFVKEVDRLMSSLTEARIKVASNNENIIEAKAEFEEVYESIVG